MDIEIREPAPVGTSVCQPHSCAIWGMEPKLVTAFSRYWRQRARRNFIAPTVQPVLGCRVVFQIRQQASVAVAFASTSITIHLAMTVL
jgi:hypothetical protein